LTLGFKKAATVAARSLVPGKPHHVQWMITRKCNYRCRGCNIWQEQDQNELSAQEIKRGLDILKNLGIVEIVFSGGDPLLRDDAQEIIEYASRSFVTTVYDNGSMAARKLMLCETWISPLSPSTVLTKLRMITLRVLRALGEKPWTPWNVA
jgi:organic radical activating enzyme